MSTLCVPHFYHSCYSKHLLKSYMAKQTAIIMGCIKRLDNYRTISKEGILWGKVGGNNSGNWRACLAKSFNIFFAAVLGHHESPKLRGGSKKGHTIMNIVLWFKLCVWDQFSVFLRKILTSTHDDSASYF